MISSELPEVLGMADRVLVVCEGRITAELAAREATPETVMRAATATRHAPEPPDAEHRGAGWTADHEAGMTDALVEPSSAPRCAVRSAACCAPARSPCSWCSSR